MLKIEIEKEKIEGRSPVRYEYKGDYNTRLNELGLLIGLTLREFPKEMWIGILEGLLCHSVDIAASGSIVEKERIDLTQLSKAIRKDQEGGDK